MSRNEEAVLVLTTTADDASARRLARTLVEERLAACVTRSTVRSVYRWEGGADASSNATGAAAGVCEDEEVLLVIKTARFSAARLEARLKELHPYECPEIVTVAPERVDAKYLAWLAGACLAPE